MPFPHHSHHSERHTIFLFPPTPQRARFEPFFWPFLLEEWRGLGLPFWPEPVPPPSPRASMAAACSPSPAQHFPWRRCLLRPSLLAYFLKQSGQSKVPCCSAASRCLLFRTADSERPPCASASASRISAARRVPSRCQTRVPSMPRSAALTSSVERKPRERAATCAAVRSALLELRMCSTVARCADEHLPPSRDRSSDRTGDHRALPSAAPAAAPATAPAQNSSAPPDHARARSRTAPVRHSLQEPPTGCCPPRSWPSRSLRHSEKRHSRAEKACASLPSSSSTQRASSRSGVVEPLAKASSK
mmetsp:Transcript_414/g.1298  ORF Transcript_414/g.1298 Transcript_414/m.1298 type:complete len:303 (+) Transcript_414:101-1009(+)